jgi:hypothetical protein
MYLAIFQSADGQNNRSLGSIPEYFLRREIAIVGRGGYYLPKRHQKTVARWKPTI